MKHTAPENRDSLERVGLVPAGGRAERIAPLPCSKELYPVGFRSGEDHRSWRPKVVSHYLLERMRWAGVRKAYVVLRPGKWDIPAYFGDGSLLNMDLAYLVLRCFDGPAYTADQAFPFVSEATVAFGFPDIIFHPDDAYAELFGRQAVTGADVVLGLFPAPEPEKADMVEIDESSRVRSIVPKPHSRRLPYTWLIAVWSPTFTRFMHEYLGQPGASDTHGDRGSSLEERPELTIGHVLQSAIVHGLDVEAVAFPSGGYLDIGTPENLVRAAHLRDVSLSTRGNDAEPAGGELFGLVRR